MTSILPGDVIFFRSTDNWISKGIARLTKSDFTHVGLVISNKSVNDSVIIIEADRFIKTRERPLTFNPALHVVFRVPGLTERQVRDIVMYGRAMVGVGYDWFQIIGLFLRLVLKLNTGSVFNRANRLICSELIDKAYYVSGVERKMDKDVGDVTPQELLMVYDFALTTTKIFKKTLYL